MPKIFLYLSSLIGVLVIFLGILSSFVSKKNNPQLQINTVQEEINEQEEKNKEPEKNEIEEEQEENIFLKVLFIIMMIIFTIIGVLVIVICILALCSEREEHKALFKETVFLLISQILMLPCSFFIKGKMVSAITFILQIIFVVGFFICVSIKTKGLPQTTTIKVCY